MELIENSEGNIGGIKRERSAVSLYIDVVIIYISACIVDENFTVSLSFCSNNALIAYICNFFVRGDVLVSAFKLIGLIG